MLRHHLAWRHRRVTSSGQKCADNCSRCFYSFLLRRASRSPRPKKFKPQGYQNNAGQLPGATRRHSAKKSKVQHRRDYSEQDGCCYQARYHSSTRRTMFFPRVECKGDLSSTDLLKTQNRKLLFLCRPLESLTSKLVFAVEMHSPAIIGN